MFFPMRFSVVGFREIICKPLKIEINTAREKANIHMGGFLSDALRYKF